MKKMLIIFSSIVIILGGSCNSKPNLTEEEIYTMINEIVADDSIAIMRVCWKFEDLQLTNVYAKEFSKKDIEFIGRQKNIFRNVIIKQNKLKWFRKVDKDFEFTTVDTLCDKGTIYHISFPIISEDRQKVLIEITEDCNCLLGGQGGKFFFEKINGHWKRTKSFDVWISSIGIQNGSNHLQ